jgi:hypothetical protein
MIVKLLAFMEMDLRVHTDIFSAFLNRRRRRDT